MADTQCGCISRAALHTPAGEAELRLSAAGNWQLNLRAEGEREWRLACSGDLGAGAPSPMITSQREPIRVGALVVDVDARRASVEGFPVPTSNLEFRLLAALAADPTRVFSKQLLMRTIWGYEAERTRTLGSHASRLRVKLRNAGAPGFIVNCKGFGYRLCD